MKELYDEKAEYRQLSLFDAPSETVAVSLMDGKELKAVAPDDWMLSIIPDGVYVIWPWKYPLVLQKAKIRPEDVEEGHQYRHYMVDGQLYAGTYIGGER